MVMELKVLIDKLASMTDQLVGQAHEGPADELEAEICLVSRDVEAEFVDATLWNGPVSVELSQRIIEILEGSVSRMSEEDFRTSIRGRVSRLRRMSAEGSNPQAFLELVEDLAGR